ncbi:MAG: hypothetical protein L3J67_13910 [Hyphomicrobiaceae bacterium]|nr:hypothetical protein [Hyphomicrobiaceae bacterium]
MEQKLKSQSKVMPSATPSKGELQDWQDLPRDEQLKRIKTSLQQAIDSGVSTRGMETIRRDARARLSTDKS